MMINICHYFLIFIIYAFIGWLMEVIISIITLKKFINRGFLIGPYCPIYGWGSLLITFLLRSYTENILVLFILAMAICMTLEYITSYLMEKVFKARWWDYSTQKYNINGRICLETAVPFGIGAIVIVYVIHPAVLSLLEYMNTTTTLIVSITIFIIFLVDNIISFNIISKFKKTNIKIRKDSTEEITNMIKDYFMTQSKLTKRLINAFPNAKTSINNIKLKQKELKREFEEKEKVFKKEIKKTEKNIKNLIKPSNKRNS